MSGSLTAEQQRRIEENRQRALARRAERLAQQGHGSCNHNPTAPQNITSRANSDFSSTRAVAAARPGPSTPGPSTQGPALPLKHFPQGPNRTVSQLPPGSWQKPASTLAAPAPKQVKTPTLIVVHYVERVILLPIYLGKIDIVTAFSFPFLFRLYV